MLTPRDREMFYFIEKVGIITPRLVQMALLPTVDISKTNQRLREMLKWELIKKEKIGLNNYYYIDKLPSVGLLEHELKISEVICYLKGNGAIIEEFKRSKFLGKLKGRKIFSDGYVIYKVVNKQGREVRRHLLLEVQRSGQQIEDDKYGKLYRCIAKYNHFDIQQSIESLTREYNCNNLPRLLIVSNIIDNKSKTKYLNMFQIPYGVSDNWRILID